MVSNQERDKVRHKKTCGGLSLWWGVTSNRMVRFKVQNFGHTVGEPSPVRPLVANPDAPIKNNLRSVLGLITVIILKSMKESFFFQRNTFTACNVRDGKEVTKSLMIFNLCKIIHSLQSKKDLKTY